MYWHVYDFLGKDNVFFKNHQGNVIYNYVKAHISPPIERTCSPFAPFLRNETQQKEVVTYRKGHLKKTL